MKNILKEYGRQKPSIVFVTMCCICFSLSVFRFLYSGKNMFLFLNWNLFLAFIPWACSSFIVMSPRLQKNKFAITIMLFVWLLFFPNAPYILTDLFHLKQHPDVPIWFDLVLIVSYAWTGLLLGFTSLFDIESLLVKFLSPIKVSILSILMLFIGSFGIYLGRYLRWNSWDIINEPFNLLYDIGHRITNPLMHPRTWGVTLFMGLLLSMIYASLKVIRAKE